MTDANEFPDQTMQGALDGTNPRWAGISEPTRADFEAEPQRVQTASEEAGRVVVEQGGQVAMDNGGALAPVAETSSEQSKTLSLEELVDDPSKLLNADTLNELMTSKSEDGEDLETRSMLEDVAKTRLLGPEQAVFLGSEIIRTKAPNLAEDIKELVGLFDRIDPSNRPYGATITEGIDGMIALMPDAKAVVEELSKTVAAQEVITERHLAMVERLKNFASAFDSRQDTTQRMVGSAKATGDGITERSRGLEWGMRTARIEAGAITERSMNGQVDPNLLPLVVQKVAERGAGSIDGHEQQCRDENGQNLDTLGEASIALGKMIDQASDLELSLGSRSRASYEIPGKDSIKGIINILGNEASSAMRAQSGVSIAVGKTVENLRKGLNDIERDLGFLKAADTDFAATWARAKSFAESLKKLKMVEAAKTETEQATT